MFVRHICSVVLVAALVLGAGCKKEATPAAQSATTVSNQNSIIQIPPSPAPDTIARVHWLGKKRLTAETNAAYFMTIWNLPESSKLEAQTLDKLALWLANDRPALSNSLQITNYSALVSSNAAASTLRQLVEDLLLQELVLEIRQPTNQAPELALAIRLDDQRAAAWAAAQGTLSNALTGLRHGPCTVTLTNTGSWTLLGLSELPGTNSLLAAFNSQIAASGNPFPTRPTGNWLEANINLQELPKLLGARVSSQGASSPGTKSTANSGLAGMFVLPTNILFPSISLTVTGDGENVRTRAELDLPQPLTLELDPWNIPTNLIHDPLIGFTAIRGIRPLLRSFKPWNDLQLGTPPNQAYFWANQGVPQFHFLALPSTEASAQVSKLTGFVLTELDPIFASNPLQPGGFVPAPAGEGVRWRGIPLFSPTLDCQGTTSNRFVFAGFSTNQPSLKQPIPQALLYQVYAPTNLCYYDWEITGSCLQGLTTMAQLSRRAFNRPRLPAEPSIAYLLALSKKLANCGTVIKSDGPSRLSLVRKSSIGLTAMELELMVDWLQSPDFPFGLYTLTAR